MKNGLDRIHQTFQAALQARSAAVMPYYTLGYPNRETSIEVVEAIAPYSDLLELGVPFSDPIADGPTIQQSTQVALENGTTARDCLQILRELRARGVQTPAIMFGYYNPLLAYGLEAYVRDAAEAGADGFIVPDLPPEEADELATLAEAAGLAYIYFLAPTSHPARVQNVVQRAKGFIYLLSLAGVTGARTELNTALAPFVERIRSETKTPLAVGFGISTPEQAAQVGQIADGVIVGSALINAVTQADNKAEVAGQFVKSLRDALAK